MRWMLIVAMLVGAAGAAPGIQVDFKMSRVHGLVNFAETISGDPHRSRTLREAFEKSLHVTGARPFIEAYKKARAKLDAGWVYPGFPVDRVNGQNLDKLVLVQSGFADDLGALGTRMLGYLPPGDHRAYLSALGALEPVYDSLVWNSSKSGLAKAKERLERLGRETDLAGMFGKAAAFYRANWPADVPFTVSIYPVPGESGHTSAESILSFESLGVMVPGTDGAAADDFGVLFHELCHSLYESQAAEFQHEWETYFLKARSPYGPPAYGLLNEGLATALGNGWARSRVATGKDKAKWYDDAYIDAFARELFPLVKAYVEVSRPLDREFAAKAVGALERAVPGAPYEYALRLKRAVLLTDGRLDSVRRELRRHFLVQSLKSSSSIVSGDALGEMRSSRESLIVVVSRTHLDQLRRLEETLPWLKLPWARLRHRGGPVVFSILHGTRPIVVIRAEEEEQIAAAFERLSRAKKIEPERPIVPDLTGPA